MSPLRPIKAPLSWPFRFSVNATGSLVDNGGPKGLRAVSKARTSKAKADRQAAEPAPF